MSPTQAADGASRGRVCFTAVVAVLMLVAVSACTDQPENDAAVGDTTLGEPDGLQPAPGPVQGHDAMQDDTVDVGLIEFQIEMPSTLPAGRTIFEVTNRGTAAHNFELERGEEEHSFPQDLQPGETRTLEVDLQEGTYEVYCPVADHEERGMALELTVEAVDSAE